MNSTEIYWQSCKHCKGQGTIRQKVRKKIKLQYQQLLENYFLDPQNNHKPTNPKGHLSTCNKCNGTGLQKTNTSPTPNTAQYPTIAIIGAGIGGVALAVACEHRGIPYTLYEKDQHFNARSQGYGLTLQQASKALKSFGIQQLPKGIVSTRHVVHTPDGAIVGEWGMRKWLENTDHNKPKHTNIHIARQELRNAFLNQLLQPKNICWNHQLIDIQHNKLLFKVNDDIIEKNADLIIGADGIRSAVRNYILKNEYPLRYLKCMVILGICPLEQLQNIQSALLDGATVFQTANGQDRIYVMPFDENTVMWQLSFPIEEENAITINQQGAIALKELAITKTQWHSPIPQIISKTPVQLISGYPVYDRILLDPASMKHAGNISLIGDAAHPMSPFKGQGANQALLDALLLANTITKNCSPLSDWQNKGIRSVVLNEFEQEMIARSASKVKLSNEAANFLHTDIVLQQSNEPRGSVYQKLKNKL